MKNSSPPIRISKEMYSYLKRERDKYKSTMRTESERLWQNYKKVLKGGVFVAKKK